MVFCVAAARGERRARAGAAGSRPPRHRPRRRLPTCPPRITRPGTGSSIRRRPGCEKAVVRPAGAVRRPASRGAQLVANPGCYPTPVILGLSPLLRAGLIEPAPIPVDGKTGLSARAEPRTSRLCTRRPRTAFGRIGSRGISTRPRWSEGSSSRPGLAPPVAVRAAPGPDGPRRASRRATPRSRPERRPRR